MLLNHPPEGVTPMNTPTGKVWVSISLHPVVSLANQVVNKLYLCITVVIREIESLLIFTGHFRMQIFAHVFKAEHSSLFPH